MAVTIRLGDDEDLETVEAMHDLVDARAFAFHQEIGRRRLSFDDVLLIAERSGSLVGYLAGTLDEEAAFAYGLAVHAKDRRAGVASQLMLAFARLADGRSPLIMLRAEPVPGQPLDDLLAFYRRCGFQVPPGTVADVDYGVELSARPSDVCAALSSLSVDYDS